MELDADSPRAGFVVLADTYRPGCRVEVDEVLAKQDTRAVMGVRPRLERCEAYRQTGENLDGISTLSEEACERWRELYRAAYQQRDVQNRIVGDHARPQRDRDQARALRREAESQKPVRSRRSARPKLGYPPKSSSPPTPESATLIPASPTAFATT